jgi:predicted XRE-type DNA-binding protein
MGTKDQMMGQIRRVIREWILEEGISQAEAARRMGIAQPNLWAFLEGADRVAVESLLAAWERTGGVWELHLGRGDHGTMIDI